MFSPYNPRTWFWAIGGDDSRLWSGRAADFVPTDDPDLIAWLALGNAPTRIASVAELVEVLASYASTVSPAPDENLAAQLAALEA